MAFALKLYDFAPWATETRKHLSGCQPDDVMQHYPGVGPVLPIIGGSGCNRRAKNRAWFIREDN